MTQRIIEAITAAQPHGLTTKAVAEAIGDDETVCQYYLTNLLLSGIISRCVGDDKTVWHIPIASLEGPDTLHKGGLQ
jgi:predicted transcriptional regulator